MVKRLLDCTAAELAAYTKPELLQAIRGCEGRVLAAESIGTLTPLLGDVTNAEFAAALGADILLLNMFDVITPKLQGLPACEPADAVRELKRLTGRTVGINLEPVDPEYAKSNDGTLWQLSPGRLATAENAKRAAAMGVDIVLLTGNPGNGVTNDAILASLRAMRAAVGDGLLLAAGKMHAAGIVSATGAPLLTPVEVDAFAEAGADIILLPAPGTVPGMTLEAAQALVNAAHRSGKLAMTAIGTSQEGADADTVRRIALMSKMAGADIHHIGDTGMPGMAWPENILAYSIAIRGRRHTYRTMARSVNR